MNLLNIFEEPSEITIFEIVAVSIFALSLVLSSFSLSIDFRVGIMNMFLSLWIMFCYDKFIKNGKSVLWKKIRI